MRINDLKLSNYRCFEKLDIKLHPSFNIIVGINGMGKTAVLEALKIAIGSLFLKFDKHDQLPRVSIHRDDVRLNRLELQYPVVIKASGTIDGGSEITWERSLETHGGKTRYLRAKEIQKVSEAMQQGIRQAEPPINIPLIAYYSTERFKKEKRDVGVVPDGSRLRGYYHSLDSQTNLKFFLDIWNTETLDELQKGIKSTLLEVVREAAKTCITSCEDMYFDIKQQLLMIKFTDTGDTLPFHILSDGVRSMLAMVMEIAFRCFLLNPHLGTQAALKTSGIILIDEIDLHLHPEWQMRVIKDLQTAFPQMQFIVTTHAPLVVGSLSKGKIYSLEQNNEISIMPSQKGYDANYILNAMGAAEMDVELKEMIKKYLLLAKSKKGSTAEAIELRAELELEIGQRHAVLQRADQIMKFF